MDPPGPPHTTRLAVHFRTLVAIQSLQHAAHADGTANFSTTAAAASAAAAVQTQMPAGVHGNSFTLSAAAAVAAASPKPGQFAPVLLIDRVVFEHGSDSFERLCWGGGPEALLAAATKQHVYIFSLRPFFQASGGPAAMLPRHITPSLPLPSTAFAVSGVYRTAMPATALNFTQNSRGLLLTDVGNNVMMLKLVPKPGLGLYQSSSQQQWQQPQQQQLLKKKKTQYGIMTAGTAAATAAAAAAPVRFSVHEAWRVRADAAHTLASASFDCYSPCATTTAVAAASGGPHKVTIWWPSQPSSSGSGHLGASAVGAEIIRHPVRVLSLDWSPPLFCLTLVIEPPGLSLTPFSRPGMRVCWARPMADIGVAAAVAAVPSPPPTGGGGGGGAGDDREQEGNDSSGGAAAAVESGSRLQWIVASVGILGSDEGEHHDSGSGHGGGGGGSLLEEAVCVWAVDGLSAVVLSGLMPRGAVSSSSASSSSAKTAASPKAVLWGLEHRTVSWLQPGKLLPSPDSALSLDHYRISAYVTYPGGMPLLRAADSCIGMQGAYAEVRTYQIAPTATSTPGGGGHTATFLRVGAVARQAMTGSPETISNMLVHPAFDVALIRDRTGGVALWSLTPLCELPLCVAPAAASARRVLLAAAGQLAAVAWLSCCSRAPLTPQYGSGGSGGGNDCVFAYAACIHGTKLLIYAVSLPCTAAAAATTAGSAVRSSTAATDWGATFVSEVLRVDLPPDVGAVRALYEISYDTDGDAPYATATLIALASRSPAAPDSATAAGTRSVGSGGGAAAARPGSFGGAVDGSSFSFSHVLHQHQQDLPPPAPQDVWVTWRLLVQPPCASTGLRTIELVSQHVDGMAAALATHGSSSTHGSPGEVVAEDAAAAAAGPQAEGRIVSTGRRDPPRATAIVSCCCTSLPSPIDGGILADASGRSGGGGSCSDAGTSTVEAVGSSSSNSSSSSSRTRRVPCLMSGTSDGHVQFWRPAAAAGGSTASSSGGGGGGGLELVQSLPCGFRRRSSASGEGDGTAAAAAAAGLVVAVALDEMSGYAAAATTCGDGEQEEAVHIWRLREDPDGDGSGGGSAATTFGQYELEAVVPVHDTVSALSWLAAAGLSACLAVGFASGIVSLMVRDRVGGWREVSSYSGTVAVAAFGSPRGAAVVMAAGNHLLCFSNEMDSGSPDGRGPEPTLAAVAADAAGPLPPYHPGVVRALVAKGKLVTACHVMRRLLDWLRDAADAAVTSREASDGGVVAGGGAAVASSAAAADGAKLGVTDGTTVARGSKRPMGRPPLVIGLPELLGDSLTASRGLAAFQQALTAPVLVAAAASPATPSPPALLPVHAAAAGPSGDATSRTDAVYGNLARGASGGRADDPSAPLRPFLPAAVAGGGGGNGSTVLAAARKQPLAAAYGGSALDSGVLDMSAFGEFGEGGGSGFATAASPPPPPPQPPKSVPAHPQETGLLDMSAFGGFGSLSTPGVATEPPRQESPPRRSALETGTLDMSAFGGFNAAAVDTTPPPPLLSTAPPSHAEATFETDPNMSAFVDSVSMPSKSTTASPVPPPQPPPAEPTLSQPQPLLSLPPAPLQTGLLDASVFGDFLGGGGGGGLGAVLPFQPPQTSSQSSPPSQRPAVQQFPSRSASASPKSSTHTAPLGLAAAVGGVGGGHVSEAVLPLPPPLSSEQLSSPLLPNTTSATQSAPQAGPPSVQSSALQTGTLDMFAFGDFIGGGMPPPPPAAPPPPPPPPPPAPAPSPLPQQRSDPMLSGMLDMSAFGDFQFAGPAQSSVEETDPWVSGTAAGATETSSAAASAATDAAASMQGTSAAVAPAAELAATVAFSAVHSPAVAAAGGRSVATAFAYPPAPVRSALETGAAGGHPAAAWDTPSLPPSVTAAAATQLPAAGPSGLSSDRTGSSSLLFTPAATLTQQDFGPQEHASPAPYGTAASGAVAAAASDAADEAENAMVVFPRVPEPATPADPNLPDLLLTPSEVAELHRLLGQNPPSKSPYTGGTAPAASGGGAPSSPPGAEAAAAAATVPPGLSVDGSAADSAVVDAVTALTALGLTPDDGADLCRLAAALSRRSVEQLGRDGGASSSTTSSVAADVGTTDVTVGLDHPARVFLIQARVAAEGAAAALAAEAGKDDGALAAAVNRLFRPVSVTRNTPPPAAAAAAAVASGSDGAAAGSGVDLTGFGLRGKSSGRDGLASSIPTPSATAGGAAGNPPGSFTFPSMEGSSRERSSTTKPTSSYSYLPYARGTAPGGGGSGLHTHASSDTVSRSRSVMSVMSVLSFSSVPEHAYGARTSATGQGDDQGTGNTSSSSSSSNWWRLCGLMPGLEMRSCLAALASGSQSQLVEAVLPAVPWVAAVDEEASVAPGGRNGGGMLGVGGAVGGGEAGEVATQSSNLKIADFLLRDFNQAEPRKSAAKNAFALLGQHRYELAAAFFILAGQLYDAVSVLVREQRDPQLALLVARLLDPPGSGPGGPVARRLIEQELMPLARVCGDPCAVATLEVLAGEPVRAVLHLVDSRSAAAGGTASPPPASPPAAAAALDVAALDYCIRIGVQYMSGKTVPLAACRALRQLALRTSRALEAAGLAAAALEALLLAAALRPAATAGAPQQPLPPGARRRYNRLVASCLSFGLSEVQKRVQEQQQQPQVAEEKVSAAAAATPSRPCAAGAVPAASGLTWQREALTALTAASAVLGPAVDEPAVLCLLGRHITALERIRQQPLVPPDLIMSRPRPPMTHGSHPAPPAPPRQAAAAAAGVAPDGSGSSRREAMSSASATAAAGLQHPLGSAAGGGGGGALRTMHPQPRLSTQQQQLRPSTSSQQQPYPYMHQQPPRPSPHISTAPTAAAGGPPLLLQPPPRAGSSGGAATMPPDTGLTMARGGSTHGGGSGVSSVERLSIDSSASSLPGSTASPPLHAGPPVDGSSYGGAMSHRDRTAAASSTSGTSDVLRRGEGGGGGGGMLPPQFPAGSSWGAFEAAWDVMAVEGDRCRSVTVQRGRGPDEEGQLPFAVATAKSGLLGGMLGPPALLRPSRPAGPSSVFLGLMQCVGRHGRAITFVGDSSSQLLVAGQGDRGGLVGWWDTLVAPAAACVAEIRGRKAVPGVLALLRPDAGGVLVFGDESGELVATDLRMMSAREFIWTLPRVHSGPITALAQWGPAAPGILNLPQQGSPLAVPGFGSGSGPGSRSSVLPNPQHAQHHFSHGGPTQARMSNLLVTGGRDGSLALVDISSGRVRGVTSGASGWHTFIIPLSLPVKVVSFLEKAHYTTRTGLPGLLAAAAASAGGGGGGSGARLVDRSTVRRTRPAGTSGAAVGGLCCMPDCSGVLSCGADGVVRYHPLSQQLLDLRRG
ncbi:hypothetical protein VOLCADRAFT_117790 [Volvox carteri f. nagariensis]|uniref:RAVE complex protein Rav1 C-terminal domain-containing protein n=1 Tax=Volvox carteri f. nagariensis TaxID=3068 RepID=D8TXR2_VOLCA|nr:uncharacterized protein VOLCADRAFT_117790 [Volvox carteri f. nagariensis]EFJ47769.1 hypothetical protein VOLCADRAFT_117790 [Volvox carteri f. nagariensis]|eukprot:XP_002951240.1 hypothetical protein VOLCADRAFT_117790 [Volvox carteri f. nagariensis]